MTTSKEQLTVEQRLEAYKHTKVYVKKSVNAFVCIGLGDYLEYVLGYPEADADDLGVIKKCFPEIFKRKPRKTFRGCWWFPLTSEGNAQREALLDECIKECEQLLTTKNTEQ